MLHFRASIFGFLTTLLFFSWTANGLIVSSEEKEFEVIPNPHDDSSNSCASNLDGIFEPYYLLTKPIPTQPDTFQELGHTKIFSVSVPVYRMKQPARISERQLEFQLILVSELSASGKSTIQPVEVDMEVAKDSWFPGYYWSPLVMHCPENMNKYQHVGWKFTALNPEAADRPHFYALMVHIEEKEKQAIEIRIGGFRAPGWMANKVTW